MSCCLGSCIWKWRPIYSLKRDVMHQLNYGSNTRPRGAWFKGVPAGSEWASAGDGRRLRVWVSDAMRCDETEGEERETWCVGWPTLNEKEVNFLETKISIIIYLKSNLFVTNLRCSPPPFYWMFQRFYLKQIKYIFYLEVIHSFMCRWNDVFPHHYLNMYFFLYL